MGKVMCFTLITRTFLLANGLSLAVKVQRSFISCQIQSFLLLSKGAVKRALWNYR